MEVPVSLQIYDYDKCVESYNNIHEMLKDLRQYKAPEWRIEMYEEMRRDAWKNFKKAKRALDKVTLNVLLQERQRLGRCQPAALQCELSLVEPALLIAQPE